jgi:hypothetical protein
MSKICCFTAAKILFIIYLCDGIGLFSMRAHSQDFSSAESPGFRRVAGRGQLDDGFARLALPMENLIRPISLGKFRQSPDLFPQHFLLRGGSAFYVRRHAVRDDKTQSTAARAFSARNCRFKTKTEPRLSGDYSLATNRTSSAFFGDGDVYSSPEVE